MIEARLEDRKNRKLSQEKALQINLDSSIYGTIVEIGAGQETARQFFSAGAAAGTVAKTMSAYECKSATTFTVRLADTLAENGVSKCWIMNTI